MSDPARDLQQRIEELTGRKLSGPVRIFRDTSAFMSIDRDDVIEIGDERFVVQANEREGRFTIDDQPKFWVKRVRCLATGSTYIMKLSFEERFKTRIGELEIPCTRSADKESAVLDRVRGDLRFMQGRTAYDECHNNVRIIERIDGQDLLSTLSEIPLSHAEYFETLFPEILAQVVDCFEGIGVLHQHRLCHGDIRNDHIFVERATGRYRWIDFDLTQPFPDFDVWSAGNVLHAVVSKGFVTFRAIKDEQPQRYRELSRDDASLFFPHRLMNLQKVFPYLPPALNQILMRFSVGTVDYYDHMQQLVDDLGDCAARLGWPAPPGRIATDR